MFDEEGTPGKLSAQDAARSLHEVFCDTEGYRGMVVDYHDLGENPYGGRAGWLLLLACWAGDEPHEARDLEWQWRKRPEIGNRYYELVYGTHYTAEQLRKVGAMQRMTLLARRGD